jgi:hypothetical protein
MYNGVQANFLPYSLWDETTTSATAVREQLNYKMIVGDADSQYQSNVRFRDHLVGPLRWQSGHGGVTCRPPRFSDGRSRAGYVDFGAARLPTAEPVANQRQAPTMTDWTD